MYAELNEYISKLLGYKAITNVCNLKYYSGGKSKEAQIKDIERYFKLDKVKSKYLIVERYIVPLERVDGRSNNKSDGNSKYYNDIEKVLLYLLQQDGRQTITCSVGKALEIVNMINQNYRFARGNIEESSQVLNVDSIDMRSFFDTYHKGLVDIFENALKKMNNQSLIFFNKCIMVSKRSVNTKLNKLGEIELDERNNPKIVITEDHYIATDEEVSLILEIEENVLKNMGYNDKQQILISGNWSYFTKSVNKILLKEGNIKYYYNAYKIICNEGGLTGKVKECQYDDSRFNLNDKMVDKLKLSVDKKIGSDSYDEEYFTNTYKLIEELVDLDSTIQLREEVFKIKNRL